MAKKFDKISPKNISEEKFNQLVDALPSSVIEQSKAVVIPPEKKEKLDKAKVKKSKSQKLSTKEKTEEIPQPSKNFPAERFTNDKSVLKSSETRNTSEVFVYECAGILFGIPVVSFCRRVHVHSLSY